MELDCDFDEIGDMVEEVVDYQSEMEEISDVTMEDTDLVMEDENLSDISGEEGDWDMEYDLDNMSLDELKDLRDELTSSKLNDTAGMEDVTNDTSLDYSYHWDGGPTHDTEWDEMEGEDPDVLERVLKR